MVGFLTRGVCWCFWQSFDLGFCHARAGDGGFSLQTP